MRAITTDIDRRARGLAFARDGVALSWAGLAAGLVDDAALRDALTDALVTAPFAAIYWETRPVAPVDVDAPFASVILDAPVLERVQADVTPFLGPLAGSRAPAVAVFPNLGGDAELVVPAPDDQADGFPHLAAFLRRAAAPQVHALWRELGRAVQRWLTTRGTRVWVSTAGLGVSWLHLRLDSRPKYVKWAPYRAAA